MLMTAIPDVEIWQLACSEYVQMGSVNG